MSGAACVPANLTAVKLPPIWGWDGWYLLAILAVMFIVIVKDWVRVEFAMLISLNMMMAAQIITVEQGFVGFSNSGVLTVTILFVVAEGLSATGAIDYLMNKLMGNPTTVGTALIRMSVPTAILSAFTNNTPQVALMIPILQVWARKVNISPSLVMLPMSYASILGGTISNLGTSTNLVVAGRAQTQYCKKIGLFDVGIVGVPVMFVGLTYILLFTQYLLPDQTEFNRRHQASQFAKNPGKSSCFGRLFSKLKRRFRHADPVAEDENGFTLADGGAKKSYDKDPNYNPSLFVLHGTINPDASIVGKAVNETGLRGAGFYLITVQRSSVIFNAVASDFVLEAGDIVSFTGGVPREFLAFASSKGITPISVVDDDAESVATDNQFAALGPDNKTPIGTVQAVIRADSTLIGMTAKEANFRAKYNAAIIAIGRAGEPLANSRLGRVVFKIGDILLLVPNEKFSWDDLKTAQDLKVKTEMELLQPIENLRVNREFVIPMAVAKKSPLIILPAVNKRSIRRSGVADVPGVALVAVERDGELNEDPQPDYVLLEKDILWFVGDRDSVTGLRRVPGLEDATLPHLERLRIPGHYRRLVEVVISHRADFVNQTVRESRFRSRYSAAIVSVLRMDFEGLRKIGDYVIKAGDTFIVDAGPDFSKFFKDDPNFSLISEIPNSSPPRWSKFYIAFTATVAMIVLEVVFSVNLAVLGIFVAFIMLLFQVLNGDRAHQSVDWGVIITVASAFGMSTALEKTYVAGIVGNAFVSLAVITGTGIPGLVCTILFSTMLFSSLIANNASALLMFPIAAQAAFTMKVDPAPILFALMLGASDYATPFGYQTNQMVQKPGGYVPIDYLKYGLPLMLLLLITETIFLSTLDYWYVSWIITIGVFLAAIVFDLTVRNKKPLAQVVSVTKFKDIKAWGRSSKQKLNSFAASFRHGREVASV